ncbi:MAG TPA: extracellular solute-binding protein [Methylomirabilota bacterium]|nr:extracellular solute-binding protein [Methylomirabilota bacterium]
MTPPDAAGRAPAGPRPTGSIQRRVLAAALALLLPAAAITVAFIYHYATQAADRAFDRLITASALTIAGAVQVEDDQVAVELPFAAFAMLEQGGDRVYYKVEAPDGSLVAGYDDLAGDADAATSAEPVFLDLDYRGEAIRLVTVGRLISRTRNAGWVTIRVAETRDARAALAGEMLSRAVLPLLAVLVLSLALVRFVVRRAFAPLAEIERELRRRAPHDAAPIRLPVPLEVGGLVSSLNDFMHRLERAMDALSAVVADAAHQVRTPLAALRAQAEVALDEPDEAALRARVRRIHNNAVQASELVNQLLMEATVAHRLGTRETEAIEVSALVEEVAGRLDTVEAARLTVRVDPSARGQVVVGDRLTLREMLRNLVDNALTYTDDAAVEIAATLRPGGLVSLSVEDRGPGLGDAEKAAVQQRFARGPGSDGCPGSGLGLSIARTVAEAHGGRLVLADRPGGGLVVTAELPATPRNAGSPAGLRAAALAIPLALAAALLQPVGPAAAEPKLYPAPMPGGGTLSILGTTDLPIFERLIRDFQAVRPDLAVIYEETDTLPLYERAVEGGLDAGVDLLVSSAADLQVKLANDGFALRHDSPEAAALPDWASWRSEVFGFTFEPAVIVYNRDLIADADAPRSHLALTEYLETNAATLRGRVATYDIAVSGVGYMLASLDSQISSNFWRLTRAFGLVDAVLSGSSPGILDRIESGELALAYNVLGSYALARSGPESRLGVILPDDYTLVLSRVMLIRREADDPDAARAFVDYALSPRGQAVVAGPAALGSVIDGVAGSPPGAGGPPETQGVIQPIPLGPGLLVGLDKSRKDRFLETWRRLVTE